MLFKKILIEKGAEAAPMTQRILGALPHLPVERVDQESGFPQVESLAESKKILYLTRFKGELIKPCPGTKDYICCGYHILHIGSNCPVDCSYCILQAYFNQPFIRLFVNTEEIFLKLKTFVNTHPGEIIRLGTGEFTDSLALDQITGFSDLLLQELSSYPQVLVELKTKTAVIHNLIQAAPAKNIIVSWSLNPMEIIKKEERGSASLDERLEAAVACQEKGYNLGFHFDPIFFFKGWEEAYQQTVQLLFSKIRAEKIAWISMGCFRFMPALKSIIQDRHPKAGYIYQEFIPALDKKMRYPQSKRVEIYKKLLGWIKEFGKEVPVYFCMENPSVWEKVFGFIPGIEVPTLKEMLDHRVKEMWGRESNGPKKDRQ
jgi:spore photoproduct lyase